MKKLIILFLLAVPCFAQTFTVSGHLFDPTNTSSSTGTITFTLVNTGDQVCRVSGTGVIVPTVKTFTVNVSTGVFSGTLYRNDFIVCGTSLNTQWQYVAQIPGSAQPACVLPQVASSSLNVDSTACSNTVPVVAAGVGDTTYCRLDGTNCGFTGPITGTSGAFTGNVSVGGTLIAAALSGPYYLDPRIAKYGAKCDSNGVTGTDDSVALQAAINDAITGNIPLWIPNKCMHSATLNMNIGNQSVWLLGAMFQSSLVYTGTGSGVLWKNGNGAPFIFNPVAYGVSFQCSNSAGCAKAVEAWSLSEGVFRDLIVGGNFTSGFASSGLWCNGCNIVDLDHLVLNGQTTVGVNTSTVGLDCINCSAMQIRNGDFFYFPTATLRFSGTFTAHITIDGNWFESQDKAILFDDTNNIVTTDGVQITHNRFLSNGAALVLPSGGGFANQTILTINNTGTNSIQMYGIEMSENTWLCASTFCTTPYPVVINYSATTGANSQINLQLRGNDFDNAATGTVNVINGPSAAKTIVSMIDNYTVTGARAALTTYVNGTATVGTIFDPFGGKRIFGTLLTLQASANSNDGSASAPAYGFTANTNSGMYNLGGNVAFSAAGTGRMLVRTGDIDLPSTSALAFAQAGINTSNAAGMSYSGTLGEIIAGNGTAQDGTGAYKAQNYRTTTNCASSGGTCAASSAGRVSIAAAATTVTVATTAVTANSEIMLTRDNSLGAALSVTCNTQSSLVLGTPYVSARTAATSFVVTIDVAPTTNPLCISYEIKN